jgi:hypothetical protein
MTLYLVQAFTAVDEYIIVGIYSHKEVAEFKVQKYTMDGNWLEIKEIELNKETEEFTKYIGK